MSAHVQKGFLPVRVWVQKDSTGALSLSLSSHSLPLVHLRPFALPFAFSFQLRQLPFSFFFHLCAALIARTSLRYLPLFINLRSLLSPPPLNLHKHYNALHHSPRSPRHPFLRPSRAGRTSYGSRGSLGRLEGPHLRRHGSQPRQDCGQRYSRGAPGVPHRQEPQEPQDLLAPFVVLGARRRARGSAHHC